MQCSLNGVPTFGFIDGGNRFAEVISPEMMRQIGLTTRDLEPTQRVVSTAKQGAHLKILGRVRSRIPLKFVGCSKTFFIRPYVVERLAMGFNISKPFLSKHNVDELHGENALCFDKTEKVCLGSAPPAQPDVCVNVCDGAKSPKVSSILYSFYDTTVPSGHMVQLPVFLKEDSLNGRTGLTEANQQFSAHTGLDGMPALARSDGVGLSSIMLLNNTEADVKITRGMQVGTFEADPVVAENWEDLNGEQTATLAAILDTMYPPDESTIAAIDGQKAGEDDDPAKWGVPRQRRWLEDQFHLSSAPGLKTSEDRQRAAELLLRHIGIFGETYGTTDLIQHEIRLTDDKPIRIPDRPMNPSLRKPLREQLDKWLKNGVIVPSKSPYSFQLVFAPKKQPNTWRTCLDLRPLNAKTIPDPYPMPSLEDIICRLENSKIFTVLDASGAYHCVKIREEDREKVAFNCCFGHFEHVKMCFGLSGAPATYNRLIQMILQDIPMQYIYAYLDDTLITGDSLDKHLEALDQVLARFAKAGIVLKPDKCSFFQEQVEFLGHQLSIDGVSPLDKHLDVIKRWPEPTSAAEVKVALGKFMYYRSFIPNAADIAAPLTELTKTVSGKPFHFGLEERVAFQKLKTALTSAPILAYPQFDSSQPFILDTDFSGKAISGILSQVQDGKERVIRYGARKTAKYEGNYESNKGEMLALLYFMRKWRIFLQYRKFTARVDHEALRWIKTQDPPRGMVARWLRTLADFDFEVIFRPGKHHKNADALSRIDHADEPTEQDENFIDEKMFAMQDQVDMAKMQAEDDVLQHVRQWLKDDRKPSKTDVRSLPREAREYRDLFEVLRLDEDGILWRRAEEGEFFTEARICLPEALQESVIKRVHEQDVVHLKTRKTQEQLLQRFYFPGAYRRVETFVACCATCKTTSNRQLPQQHTHATVQEGYPWKKIAIDFLGPYKRMPSGAQYVLTAKDTFSRWLIAIPMQTITAQETAMALEQHVFLKHGTCEQILSDNGAQLTSALLAEVYDILGIQRTTTPAYNPKSNPVERSHKDLNMMVKAMCQQNQTDDWQSHLQACVFALNTSRNRSTGMTPHFILYGREARIKTDLIFGSLPRQPSKGPSEYANQLRDRLQMAYRIVRANLGRAIERTRYQYSETDKDQFKVGDLVWLCTPYVKREIGKKLNTLYTGPYRITEKIASVLFRIVTHGEWNRRRVNVVVSIDRISHYRSTLPPVQMDLNPDDIMIEDEFLENVGEMSITGDLDVVSAPTELARPVLKGAGAVVWPTPAASSPTAGSQLRVELGKPAEIMTDMKRDQRPAQQTKADQAQQTKTDQAPVVTSPFQNRALPPLPPPDRSVRSRGVSDALGDATARAATAFRRLTRAMTKEQNIQPPVPAAKRPPEESPPGEAATKVSRHQGEKRTPDNADDPAQPYEGAAKRPRAPAGDSGQDAMSTTSSAEPDAPLTDAPDRATSEAGREVSAKEVPAEVADKTGPGYQPDSVSYAPPPYTPSAPPAGQE